ncbi:MAG: hypothetical protein H2069_04345 [Legionella sp.]|nr:hypothetical protein [Legionella sp.]
MKQLFEEPDVIIKKALSLNWDKISDDHRRYYDAVVNRLGSKPDKLKALKVNEYNSSLSDVIHENLEHLKKILTNIKNNQADLLKTFKTLPSTLSNLSAEEVFAVVEVIAAGAVFAQELMSCLSDLEEVKETIQNAFNCCMEPVPDFDEVNTTTNPALF